MNTTSKAIPAVLVVDDERAQRDLVSRCLSDWGFEPLSAHDGEEALAILERSGAAMVISDVRMPRLGGMDLVAAIRSRFPQLPVLLITAFPDIREAVAAVKDGALDYLTKPIDLDELRDLVQATLGVVNEPPTPLPALPAGMICRSPQMQHVVREAHLVSRSDVTVLITGESGTGKEAVADLIHAWGDRANRPWLKLNCAAIPENMVESELFGHERGAFTGAVSARDGRWKAADGGTLLLDEVGELPLALQAKLLRALQDGSYSPLGSDRTLKADVRVIAATNRDLESEVEAHRFREDLYYRLNVVEIHLPPLRERSEDIPLLARVFAVGTGGEPARISPAAQRLLTAYAWPGNIRELRNVLARACLMAQGGIILPEHLPPRLLAAVGGAAQDPPPRSVGPDPRTLAEVEKERILAALAAFHGNRTRAAQQLGIGRRTLIYKLKSYAEETGGA